ncbi:phospholipase D-like domain-containing protein [Haloarculaceae archaeon H-GB2-1]|nr:phospholipase D-like domain-containing protein [Haloarculaceae archaeon H-GB1-1]MEA5386903.1 phospholipase D-like domain-containing protein [Haloarculaceae archaeon H-GB11]MEA5408385.1 phospholipase D-like domain-containing protein [Haloarculaceae archaeon H-GB2-1]
MSRPRAAFAVIVLLSVAVGPSGVTAATSSSDAAAESTPRIVGAYPNPVADEDATEFVVLDVPSPTGLDAYSLSDGDRAVELPNTTVSGRVVLTHAPERVRELTDDRVLGVDSSLGLANGGETLTLRRNGTTVDTAVYREAPTGKLANWSATDRGLRWETPGTTSHPIVEARNTTVRTFVLPDGSDVVPAEVAAADERILLAGYTFGSERLTDRLAAAARRGVTVRVLLEGDPVGGLTTREARLLDGLVAAGVDVRLLGGPYARYDFHHAKYAVVDDSALVLTENFKPAGTGGRSSRGWGVVLSDPQIVGGLAETFRADADWRAARPWSKFRRGRTFEQSHAANGSYPTQVAPEMRHAERVELLVTPDNAESRLVSLIDAANESVRVIQVSVDDRRGPFVTAALRAARRGVDVRLLLSSAWYVREDNRRLADALNERADDEDLPLTVKLADPRGRYEKIHAKGVVVDDHTVVLGSLNWNRESARNNREVLAVLHGESVAEYYGRVFDADWGDRGTPLPVGLLGGVAGCLVVAGLVVRRIEFDR